MKKQQDKQHCPKCHAKLPEAFLLSAAGTIYARRRTVRKGNPKILRPCPFCLRQFGMMELREHKPRCPKKTATKKAVA